jgi:hypothetical protein
VASTVMSMALKSIKGINKTLHHAYFQDSPWNSIVCGSSWKNTLLNFLPVQSSFNRTNVAEPPLACLL